MSPSRRGALGTTRPTKIESLYFIAASIDLLVDDEVVVELKSVTRKEPVFFKQCLTYLRFIDKRLGFVINFVITV